MAIAERAALAGGAVLMDRFGGTASGIASKSSATDPVSDADRASEAAIRAVIAAERPDDALLGEEGGEQAGSGGDGLRWVVDPLDGTVNYLFGLPAWSVSIACEDAAGVLVGVVFDPTRDEIVSRGPGGGALLGDVPLRVRPPADPALALVATGFSYAADVRERQAALTARVLPFVRDLRRVGSAALDLAWTAAGRFDAYLRARRRITGTSPRAP